MSERAKEFMDMIWKCRDNGSDTEEKLASSILNLAADYIKNYQAQNNMVVLDKNDLLQLSNELNEISK
jgi:hypothetical protein